MVGVGSLLQSKAGRRTSQRSVLFAYTLGQTLLLNRPPTFSELFWRSYSRSSKMLLMSS